MHVIRYYSFKSGYRVGLLVKEDDKFSYVIIRPSGEVKLKKFDSSDDEAFEFIDSDPKKARAHFAAMAKRYGISDQAAQLLKEAA